TLTDKTFAKDIDNLQKKLATYIKTRRKISTDEIIKIIGKDNINAQDYEGKWLFLATTFNQITLVQDLIAKGANTNAVYKDDLTPLHLACQNNLPEIASLLLKHKANANAITNNGSTPLHLTCQKG